MKIVHKTNFRHADLLITFLPLLVIMEEGPII